MLCVVSFIHGGLNAMRDGKCSARGVSWRIKHCTKCVDNNIQVASWIEAVQQQQQQQRQQQRVLPKCEPRHPRERAAWLFGFSSMQGSGPILAQK